MGDICKIFEKDVWLFPTHSFTNSKNRQEERWKDIIERPNQDWFEKDISQCILSNDSECDFGSD